MKQTIRVLHVEDDPMQRALMSHHLKGLPEYACDVTGVDTETKAIAEFRQHPHDLILIDFQLADGNGLSCLRAIRAMNAHVPVLAISGEATPDIAAQLLQYGADDYLEKRTLTATDFAGRVRMALKRAEAAHRRAKHQTVKTQSVTLALVHLFREFLKATDRELLQNLREVETAAREAHVSAEQVPFLFETAEAELTASGGDTRLRLRPLLFELQYRLNNGTR